MSKPPIHLIPKPRLVTWRRLKDALARYTIALGGLSVIFAVMLILFYLAWEVLPLFQSARVHEAEVSLPPLQGTPVYLEVDEQEEIALTLTSDGLGAFNQLATGALVKELRLPTEDRELTVSSRSTSRPGFVALGMDDGRVLPIRVSYQSEYPQGRRIIVPTLEYPYGESPIDPGSDGTPVTALAFADDEDRFTLATLSASGKVWIARFDKVSNFLTGEVSLERTAGVLSISGSAPRQLALSANQRFLHVAMDEGTLAFVDIGRVEQPVVVSQQVVSDSDISHLSMLLGGISLLVGDDQGHISQFFPVQDDQGRYQLERIRDFKGLGQRIVSILPEQRRKGFVAIDATGTAAIYHATAHRQVVKGRPVDGTPLAAALSPRSRGLVLIDAQSRGQAWQLDNEHPEVSWAGLWGRVWYENYRQAEFTWQSSAANNDFEPKFSLTPLAFGTLKSALYAMLFAVPLAVAAAVYTAFFMAPGMRRLVKPTIEIMAALPTVILGFLAGLWFAPFLEANLAGVLLALVVVPLGILGFAWVWQYAPETIRHRFSRGWQSAVLLPIVVGLTWSGLALGQPLEQWLLGTELRIWLNNELGVTYDQRNALVVGVAMGFAVIPTIFSIAEDAVFSVPQSLTQGSLALGATPWQSVVRVVLPTASPGIFSALMIGFGRAVGETMIVLMATGNTPIMDMNIFEGMRTLAANIAVEMPESEVGSTHFRVLFLAAFVLFIFTFVFNTGAEIIRQRLREKYSSL